MGVCRRRAVLIITIYDEKNTDCFWKKKKNILNSDCCLVHAIL